MSNYTVFIDDDKKQTNGSAITATSTVVDGGAAAGVGTAVPSGSKLTAILAFGDSSTVHGSQVVQSKDLFGAFQSSSTTLTSVADNGSGFCRFTKSSHGLSVGDVISVTGSTSGNVDGVQKVTAVPTSGTFDTDKAYTAAATAGVWKTVAGRFASMTAEQYIMRGYASSVANGQATTTGFGGDPENKRSIHKVESLRTVRTATAIRAGYWNEFSGTWSTDPTNADDISTAGTDQVATLVGYATPGEFVYRVSGQPDASNGVKQADYTAKTN